MALAAGSGSLAAEQAAFETQWGSFLESAAARKQAREEARRDRILQHAAWIIQSRPLARGWDGWRLSVERRVESHENVHRDEARTCVRDPVMPSHGRMASSSQCSGALEVALQTLLQ